MQLRTLTLGAAVALAAVSFSLLDRGAQGQKASTPKLPSLQPIFGPGADAAWSTVAGTYTIAGGAALGKPVLTPETSQVILESKDRSTGPREARALVRLHGRGTEEPAHVLRHRQVRRRGDPR